MGEFEIIDRIIRHLGPSPADVIVGPGDDCACVEAGAGRVLLTDDAMVEDVHFTRAVIEPAALGRRAAAVAISDIAAMGGTPRWLLASVGAPEGSGDLIEEIASGLAGRAAELGAVLVGGNLTRSSRIFLSMAVVGTVDGPPLVRSGARPGDLVALTGTIGGSALGLGALLRSRESPFADRWRDPPARVEAGRALRPIASAAIDVSDGFLQDLGHVLASSRAGARIELARLPLPQGYLDLAPAGDPLGPALSGGEDYELILAIPPSRLDAAVEATARTGCGLTVVGSFTGPGDGLVLVHPDGREVPAVASGWDHFPG